MRNQTQSHPLPVRSVEWQLAQARNRKDLARLATAMLSWDTYIECVGAEHYAWSRHADRHLLGSVPDAEVSVEDGSEGHCIRIKRLEQSALVRLADGAVVNGRPDKRDLDRLRMLTRHKDLVARALARKGS